MVRCETGKLDFSQASLERFTVIATPQTGAAIPPKAVAVPASPKPEAAEAEMAVPAVGGAAEVLDSVEAVLKCHASGGKSSGLDLSGLDFSGAIRVASDTEATDFRRAPARSAGTQE